jgi:hypothetical protein
MTRSFTFCTLWRPRVHVLKPMNRITIAVLRSWLRFAACSVRCRDVAMSAAVWARPFRRLADAYQLTEQLDELKREAHATIPPYAGPALRRPHRTPWSTEDIVHKVRVQFAVEREESMLSRIVDGTVQDRFFPTCEKSLAPEQRSSLWVTRQLPISCCSQRFETHADLVQYLHRGRTSSTCPRSGAIRACSTPKHSTHSRTASATSA